MTYTQEFGRGGPVAETVRLVEEQGEWHWFFGRSQEFVNEQIRRHAPDSPLLDDSAAGAAFPTNGAAPWGLDAFAATGVDADALLASFPPSIGAHQLERVEPSTQEQSILFDVADEVTYLAPPEVVIPSGESHVLRLTPGIDATQALAAIVDVSRQSPHFVVLRESDERSGGMVYLLAELYTIDAMGNVPVLFWGEAEGDVLVAASMRDFISLRLLIQKLAVMP